MIFSLAQFSILFSSLRRSLSYKKVTKGFLMILTAEGSCDTPGKDNIIRLTGSNGSITLPKPSNNRSCTWIITVPERNVVKLMISSYDLKNSTLQYGDGQNSSSEVLETFSGEDTEKTVLSSGRHLWARFQSIQDEQAEFFARYEAFAESKTKS